MAQVPIVRKSYLMQGCASCPSSIEHRRLEVRWSRTCDRVHAGNPHLNGSFWVAEERKVISSPHVLQPTGEHHFTLPNVL